MAGKKTKPVLNLKFISHGTLKVEDIKKSARFYEEFLGLEFVQTASTWGMVRLGGQHVYVVLQVANGKPMPFTNHNGIDVPSRECVDKSYELCLKHKEEYELKRITEPIEMHEVYGFYFRDRDANFWELLYNPEGGYTWLFEKYLTEPSRELLPN